MFKKKSKRFEHILIEAVKKQPVLYDKKNQGYNNKLDVDTAWNEVFKEVKKDYLNKDISVMHCKLRWRSLRDRYVKQVTITPSGDILNERSERWEYAQQLNFLAPHLTKRKIPEDLGDPASFASLDSIDNVHFKNDSLNQIAPNELLSEPVQQIELNSNHCNNAMESTDEIEVADNSCANDDIPLNNFLENVNRFIEEQRFKDAIKSPNEDYFRVLDSYFSKLPEEDLDRVKVEILSLVLSNVNVLK